MPKRSAASRAPAKRGPGWKKLPQPSPHVGAILSRTARGFILRTNTVDDKGRPVVQFCYDDGTVIRNARHDTIDAGAIARMVGEGWLIPIEGETLPLEGEDGPPQRYRARTLADGLLPRFVKA